MKESRTDLLRLHGEKFSEITAVAREVLLLLQQRKKLQEQINEFRSDFDDNTQKGFVFNVVTQRMMSETDNGSLPHRRRRLERGKVGVLQSW